MKLWSPPSGTETSPEGLMDPPIPALVEIVQVTGVSAMNEAAIVWSAVTPVNS